MYAICIPVVRKGDSSMKKAVLYFLGALLILLMVGIAGASTPLIVGGGWTTYAVPSGTPPVHWVGAPYTFSSSVPTHLMYADGACIGDVSAFYEGGVMIGQGSPVTSEYPACAGILGGDAAYADGRFSRTCIDLPAGDHEIDVWNTQMYHIESGDGGYIRVDEGYCPGTTPAPEFPGAFVPTAMIIGLLGTVLLIKRMR